MSFIVKNTTLPNPLELIAPLPCRGCGRLGTPLCENCKKYIISHHTDYCPKCKQPKTPPNSNHQTTTNPPAFLACPHCKNLPPTFVLDTRQTLIGTLIHDLKYNSVRSLARPIAEILHQTFPPISGKVSIVPLPTISRHIRARGLDHTLLIAKHFARLRGKNCQVEKLLVRHKNTTQVGANRETRLAQATEAYVLAENTNINDNTTYILFDDVWTTGASMESAYKTFLATGASKIVIAALALSNSN